MAGLTKAKRLINLCLQYINLRLDTLTAKKIEGQRLAALEDVGHFDHVVFPAPYGFSAAQFLSLLQECLLYEIRFSDFTDPSRNDVGYSFENDYFTSPDAEILYAIVRKYRPAKIVEVGSGYSTKVLRQAILDGHLNTRLICIDPRPRVGVETLADEIRRVPVERMPMDLFRSLASNDILFIDSSHVIKTGGDVVFLYLIVLPELSPGTLIHIHDIFLPYEYPREWVVEKQWGWNEQYLVQAMLMFSDVFEVLWAGHFLQRTWPDFEQYFPHLNGRSAKSLWLRKKG